VRQRHPGRGQAIVAGEQRLGGIFGFNRANQSEAPRPRFIHFGTVRSAMRTQPEAGAVVPATPVGAPHGDGRARKDSNLRPPAENAAAWTAMLPVVAIARQVIERLPTQAGQY
jgi:hypothetical protein